MKISKVTYDNRKNNPVFRWGLTSAEVQAVNSMTKKDCVAIAEKISNKYGVQTRLFEVPALTFCVEKTLEIMSKAGFKLPENILFLPLEPNVSGCYNNKTDTVVLNCLMDKYYNLEKMNEVEEAQGSFHPQNHHFLQTFLHEFSHAAHYKNLCNRLGDKKGLDVYWGALSTLSPRDIMINPVKTYLSLNPILKFSGILEKFFPPKYGYYSATDLTEYFAEKNSHDIAEQLGKNFNISNVKKDQTREYKIRPSSWSFASAYAEKLRKRTLKEKLACVTMPYFIYIETRDVESIIKDHLDYTNNDIWDGREENLVKNKFLQKNV